MAIRAATELVGAGKANLTTGKVTVRSPSLDAGLNSSMRILSFTRNASLVTAILFLGSIVMWIGVPAAWLYVGSVIKTESGSLGLAVAVMMAGAVATVAVIVRLLNRLNEAYAEAIERRDGERPFRSPLEPVLVVSAGVALAIFSVWFLIFAGASPAPLNLSF